MASGYLFDGTFLNALKAQNPAAPEQTRLETPSPQPMRSLSSLSSVVKFQFVREGSPVAQGHRGACLSRVQEPSGLAALWPWAVPLSSPIPHLTVPTSSNTGTSKEALLLRH